MYYDIKDRIHRLRAINIIIGGRGIGKTYSALSFMMEQEQPFIYLRNTDVQMQESSTTFGNPFKRLNRDKNRYYEMVSERRHYLIQDKPPEQDPLLVGYGAALSTFSNLRGVDLSDCGWCVFDEFIERRSLSFKQFDAFAGFYETVNRNREIQGEEPFRVILLSNSQTLQNDILAGYGLITKITEMIKNGERIYSSGALYLELPSVEISTLKKETANYKLISGSAAAREALENEFVYDSMRGVGRRPLQEYRPLCIASGERGSVAYYKHKSDGSIYVCQTPSWSCKLYDKDQYMLFMKEYGLQLREYAIRGKMTYENYQVKIISEELLKS